MSTRYHLNGSTIDCLPAAARSLAMADGRNRSRSRSASAAAVPASVSAPPSESERLARLEGEVADLKATVLLQARIIRTLAGESTPEQARRHPGDLRELKRWIFGHRQDRASASG